MGPLLSASGFVKTQGEILADLLETQGYTVIRKSIYVNKILRFLDTVAFLLLKRSRYDTVIIQVYGGLSFIMEDVASLIARLFRKKVIMTLHGGALPEFLVTRKNWATRVFSRADCITCPSLYLCDKLSFLGIEISVIPNIITLSEYRFKNRSIFRPRIFWMRAYHEIYNPTLAIAVFENICEYYPEAELTMAGPDMGLFKEVKRVVAKSKNKARIKTMGLIDLSMKQSLADHHDIYLNTNVIDNTPVSMIEMAAFGLALVSTNVGGIPYLFKHQSSAMLSASQNPGDLAQCISEIIKDPDLGRKLVSEAKLITLNFDKDQVYIKWNKILSTKKCAV